MKQWRKTIFIFSVVQAFTILENSPTEPPPRTLMDPEIHMNATEMIEKWGYVSEEYDATTDDGYILKLVRILPQNTSHTKKAPVIFLQHGLECSCVDWLNNLPGQSAGYYFAKAGFDVWLGNFRGNMYSRRHIKYTAEDDEFWQFTWDHMAKYDIPAMINKVLEVTGNERLFYVGHSEGTLTAFAKFSSDPSFAKKIHTFFALAPVVSVKNIKGPFRAIASFTSFPSMFKMFCGKGLFLLNKALLRTIATTFCPFQFLQSVCGNFLMIISGTETQQLNTTRIPVYVAHTPSGTSTLNVIHFGQMVRTGQFKMYDYGSAEENKKHYDGSDTPPLYDIKRMKVPTILFYSTADYLATPEDVEQSIIGRLRTVRQMYKFSDFNHLDFIWGLRAAERIYRPIERYIRYLPK